MEVAKISDQSTARRKWITYLALLSAAWLSVAAVGESRSRASSLPAAGAEAVQTPDDPAGAGAGRNRVGERRIIKVLPDMKMLAGSPDVSLEITDAFGELFSGDEPVEVEILFNKKKKVVEAQVVGGALVLKPGSIGRSELRLEARQGDAPPVHTKFEVEVWKPNYSNLALAVLGGLGLFLLGMKSMSDGLQAIAGNGLRRMIALVTDNRLMATGIGTLVTMLVQSSSITTVMVVGFVNSGFMTLSQAIGVIFGANIGTTITGWILVLNIGAYGLPLAGFGAICYLFIGNDRWRYAFMGVMGLGLIFLGLELMKDGFAVIKDLPAFEVWFERFNADTYFGVLKCAAVGCVLTFIVQSSSATLGITIGLAQIGVIPFETAAALVLGENIGTTITAWLASFGATISAKRAAYAHIIFNVLGVVWITAVFPWYVMLVRYMVAGDASADMSEDVTAAIAATHTGFNVTNTLLFLPLAGVMAKALERFMPERVAPSTSRLTRLDVRVLESPVIAIEQSRSEVLRMAESCDKMMGWLRQVLENDPPDEAVIRSTFEEEKRMDVVQDEIVSFITTMLGGNVPERLIQEVRRQLRLADELESVSDYISRILKYELKLREVGLAYDERERNHLLELHRLVTAYLEATMETYQKHDRDLIQVAELRGQNIANLVRQLRREIMDRMTHEAMPPRLSVTYNRQINAYRRIRDHVLNIVEVLAGAK